MGKITVETCEIEGLKVITPAVFGDARGYFMETYHYEDYKAAGIDQVFVQDNQSASVKGVLRGLHFQINYPQDKLVRVIQGEVYDVAVDLRPGSATYGKWYGVLLSAENKKQFLEWWEKSDMTPLEIVLEQIIVYFISIYLPGAVYDENIIGKVEACIGHGVEIYMLLLARWIKKKESFGMNDLIELVYRYSREIEHSDENLEKVEMLCWF